HVHGSYMRHLERTEVLERRSVDLPSDKTIAERRTVGRGLTGPEFATLLSYTKMNLKEQIGLSNLADDPYLADTLTTYFPSPLRTERFAEGVHSHPLSKEIIVNQVVNQMVNRSGMTFAFRVNEEDRKSTRLNSSHVSISYAVFCLRKKIRRLAAIASVDIQ